MIAAQIIAPKIAPEMIHQPLVICSIVLSFAVCPVPNLHGAVVWG
jgi:hypothetical protein